MSTTSHLTECFPEHSVQIDLRDYADFRIDDYGDFALHSLELFQHPIAIQLGRSVLTVALAEPPTSAHASGWPKNYVVALDNVKNHTATKLYLASTPAPSGVMTIGEGTYATAHGQSLDIGRASTPELTLDDAVSARHLSLRFGVLHQYLHFTDLGSVNGTVVALHPDDESLIFHPSTLFRRTPNGPERLTARNHAWLPRSVDTIIADRLD